jgi:hypothetical protein
MDRELLNCWSAKRFKGRKIAVLRTLEAVVSSSIISFHSNSRYHRLNREFQERAEKAQSPCKRSV